MDKEKNTELQEIPAVTDESTEILESVGNSVKKIIVPMALTVGLLGNTHQSAADVASNVTIPDSDNIIISEVYADTSSPIILEGEYDDSEEDEEEKKNYKGSNLAKSAAYSSLITATGAAESTLSQAASGIMAVLMGGVMKFAGVFGIISVLFLGTFKAIYPDRKIKEIISPKNISRTAVATVAVIGVFYILDSITTQRNVFMELIKNSFVLVVLMVLWFRVFELKGNFGEVMKALFWGKKGKILLCALVGFNLLISIAHIAYNAYFTTNTFVQLICFYAVCVFSMGVIYNLAKGRMIEDDDLEKMKNAQAEAGL